MPTAISHAIVGFAAAKAFAPSDAPRGLLPASVACAALPDLDVLTSWFGVANLDLFGHRGFSHSFFFAVINALLFTAILLRNSEFLSKKWLSCFIFLFLVTASHGLLDAMTNARLGVALLAPFDNSRFLFPWKPMKPIGFAGFFTDRVYGVLQLELLWIWLPSSMIVTASMLYRNTRTRPAKVRSE
ncbi:MAG: metal-dependent hydrolase [Syntrophobacteraceae bacterium]